MPTYLTHDGEGNARPVPFAKPTPAHALTDGAEAARQSMRDLPPVRVVHDVVNDKMVATRQLLTRPEVEAAYVHPEPEEPAHEVDPQNLKSVGARRLVLCAIRNGHRVKATRNRGTTTPKWWVNAPDSRPNPGPPVAADQYHGKLAMCETVYVVPVFDGRDLSKPKRAPGRVKGVWLDGRIDRVEVDGVKTTLDLALEVLS